MQALINLCDYEGIHISGLENPGIYMYDDEAGWHGCNTWVNLTEGLNKIEEMGNTDKDKVAHAYATLFNLNSKATKRHIWEAIEEAIGYLGEVLR